MDGNNIFENKLNLSSLNEAVEKLKAEIGQIVVGQEKMIDLLVAAILADGHILLEGVPGVAKTLTAKLIAKCFSVDYSRIQFTPDLMPSDVLGTSVFNSKTNEFEYKQGPIFSNIVLIDEINRSPAKTQAALFEVMEEKQITADGHVFKLPPPFLVIATQNPVEQEGTYRLPEAQLDRFIFKVFVDYPSLLDETEILTRFHKNENTIDLNLITPVISGDELQSYKTLIGKVHIDAHLIKYIAQITDNTRTNSSLYLGASPRASLSMLKGAKALAAIAGREFVTPEDIKEIAVHVLNHRIMLTPDKEMEGVTTQEVIREIVEQVEIPR